MTANENIGSGRRALVVGLGVSGIATAARLRRAGWEPMIVEKAPGRRAGGYFVALFGAGRAAAERLGMSGHLHNRLAAEPGREIDRSGRTWAGMSYADAPGSPWMMMRGDVEAAAYATLPADVPIRYSTTPTAIEQDGDEVDVTLLDTATGASSTERFDLVVGADGLRSTVRRLVFGPHEDHLRRLNYMIAAFELPATPVWARPGQSVNLLEPDRCMFLFAFADREPTVLLSYRTDDVDAEFTGAPADRLRAAFGPAPLGPVLEDMLDAFDAADDKLFDSAEQVHMDRWSRGRVVLVGDAAWCTTLYAGMGVSSGLTGAELLGAALERHPDDVATALAEWEHLLRPYIADYQQDGIDQRKIFVPDSWGQVYGRRLLSRAGKLPLAQRLLERFVPPPGTKDVDVTAATSAALTARADAVST